MSVIDDRFVRQLPMFAGGADDQARLRGAIAVVCGVGGLGCAASMYLAAAGTGTIVLIDHETVDQTNLNRQILYAPTDIGQSKTLVAAARLAELFPDCAVTPVVGRLEETLHGFSDADVVFDCLDSVDARLHLARLVHASRQTTVSAACEGLRGHVAVLYPDSGACLGCLYPRARQSGPVPVLGATPGALGAAQAAAGVQLLTGRKPLYNELFVLDLEQFTSQNVVIGPHPHCPVCGGRHAGQV